MELSDRSLSNLICSKLDIEFRSNEFYEVLEVALSYVSHAATAFDFQREMKNLVDFKALDLSAKDFRLLITRSKTCTVNLRYYCINLARTRGMTGRMAAQLAYKFDVPSSDAKTAYTLFGDSINFRRRLKTAERIAELDKSTFTVEAYRRLDKDFREMYPKLMGHVRHVTYSKLRFISTSTNTELSDLHHELLVQALKAYQSLVPTNQPPAYVMNYVKRSVSNHVLNLIYMYTAEKRARLVRGSADGFGSDSFMLVTSSENQLNINLEDGEQLPYDSLLDSQLAAQITSRREGEFTLEQILDRYQHAKRKHRVLSILSGKEDPEFTEWLRNERYLRKVSHDNIDYQERCEPHDYVKLICEFLNIKQRKVFKFLKQVGDSLHPAYSLV